MRAAAVSLSQGGEKESWRNTHVVRTPVCGAAISIGTWFWWVSIISWPTCAHCSSFNSAAEYVVTSSVPVYPVSGWCTRM